MTSMLSSPVSSWMVSGVLERNEYAMYLPQPFTAWLPAVVHADLAVLPSLVDAGAEGSLGLGCSAFSMWFKHTIQQQSRIDS